jgi:serine/threonine protein kinase
VVAQNGPLPVAEACEYVRQAALGLQHAFEHGLIHCDVKPQNLMRTPAGQIKVLDFGLAQLARESGEEATPRSGTFAETPDYTAPEQARDPHRADIRADVYGLGGTLYFLLTGQPPFPGGSALQKLLAHQDRPPRAVSQFREEVPAERRDEAIAWLRDHHSGPEGTLVRDLAANFDRAPDAIDGFLVMIGPRLLRSRQPTLLAATLGRFFVFPLRDEQSRELALKEGAVHFHGYRKIANPRRTLPHVKLTDLKIDQAQGLDLSAKITGSVAYEVQGPALQGPFAVGAWFKSTGEKATRAHQRFGHKYNCHNVLCQAICSARVTQG